MSAPKHKKEASGDRGTKNFNLDSSDFIKKFVACKNILVPNR